MERKNFSLKDIGLPKLVIMLVTGILIVLLSVPGLFGSDKKGTGKINDGNLQVVQKDMNMTSSKLVQENIAVLFVSYHLLLLLFYFPRIEYIKIVV